MSTPFVFMLPLQNQAAILKVFSLTPLISDCPAAHFPVFSLTLQVIIHYNIVHLRMTHSSVTHPP